MRFLITNRFAVENNFPKSGVPTGLISIRDPGEPPINYDMAYEHGDVCAILSLPSFHDVDSIEIADKYKLTAFTPELAKEVLTWMTHVINYEIELIIVQCNAGISRSAGMAAALSLIVNGDDSWVFNNKKYCPNRLVYRTILRAHYNELLEDHFL